MKKFKKKGLIMTLALVMVFSVFAGLGFNKYANKEAQVTSVELLADANSEYQNRLVYNTSVKSLIGAGSGFAKKMLLATSAEPLIVGDSGYATFVEAYNAANSGDTIKLEKDADVTRTGDYGFTFDKGITLDLNNHTLHYTGDMYGLYVIPTSDIIIKNGIITSAAPSTMYLNYGKNLTLENVTLENSGSGTNHFSFYATKTAKSVIFKGNTNLVYNTGTPTIGSFYINSAVNASVEAGTYNFNPIAYVDSTKYFVDNTSISGYYVVKTNVSITANTGLFENDTEQIGVPNGKGYTLSGTYKATVAGDYTAIATLDEGYVWEDTHTTESRDIAWSIGESVTVAKIGDTEYKTLSGALKAAQAGSSEAEKTVTIVKTVEGFTFDGNYDGIIIQGVEDNKITGNFVAAQNASLKGMKIRNLKFENCGIDFSALGVNVEELVISDCEFDGSETTSKQRAIMINANNAKNLLIDNNTIKNYMFTDSTAILICTRDNFTDFAQGYVVTISNNTIENIAYNAIQATGIKNLKIIGNNIINTKKNKGPINVSNSENIIISNNNITLAENYVGVFYNINKGIVIINQNKIKDSAGVELPFDEDLANVNNEYDGVLGTGIIVLESGEETKYIAVSENVVESSLADLNIALIPGANNTFAPVAIKIDETEYVSLDDSINGVVNGGTIKLVADNEETIIISKAIKFNIDAGEYKNNAKISAGTGYTLSSSKTDKVTTYTVKKLVAFDEEYKWNNGKEITYGDTYSEIAPTVKADEEILTGIAFTYTYYSFNDETWKKLDAMPKKAGHYKVEIAVNSDNTTYAGQIEVEFTIAKKEVELVWTEPKNLIYDGKAKTPSVAVKESSLIESDSCNVISGVTTDDDNINVGTFTFTAQKLSNSNYKLPANVISPEYTITAKSILTNDAIQKIENQAFTGSTITPNIVVKDGNKTLVKDIDYTVEYSNNINVGTALVKVTFKGNYKGTISKTFIIAKEAEDERNPKTGDNIVLYLIIGSISLISLVGCFLYLNRKRFN